MISITVDPFKTIDKLTAIQERQMPYAFSLALNRTAEEFQEAQRASMRRNYTVRRPWVLQGIKIERNERATKDNYRVVVSVDPERDFMVKFEEGEKKRASRKSIAIPVNARRTKADIVPQSQRPKSFQFYNAFTSIRTRQTVYKGNRRTFMIQGPDGRGWVFQRAGARSKKKVNQYDGRAYDIRSRRRRDPKLRLLYSLAPEAMTPRTLGFEALGRRVFEERFPVNFQGFFAYALRTAKA